MLDLIATNGLTDADWQSLDSRTELPWPREEFFAPQGDGATHGESRRQYHRFYLREPAVLARDQQLHAVYTKDASRKGIGVLSPVQLFPGEEVKLALNEHETILLRVRRCRRLADNCYDCGTMFASGLAAPKIFKELMLRRRKR